MKDLIINNKVYAVYLIKKKIIYLKVIVPHDQAVECFIISIIQFVENRVFTSSAYLNV